MSNNLLDTKTMSFRDLVGNGKKYIVPMFQRDYSWKEENWEELWLDIELLHNTNDIHYLGTIVLKAEGNKKFIIIDGQQRIATISLIVLAAVKIINEFIKNNIEVEANNERKNILLNNYLGSKDAASLTYSSKLALNETNDNFYQTYLMQLNTPLNKSKLNDSNKLLLSAFDYFLDKIRENPAISKNGESLAKFIESIIADKLIFIQITVDDELSAYTVFETLNARGLELTSIDLLKNYLFSMVKSDIDRKNLKNQWQMIISTVGIRKLPQFLRYFINGRQKLVRKDRLFKEIKNKIKQEKEVFELLQELEKYADIYSALDDDENELWKTKPDIKKIIREIALFDSEQHKLLLMNAYFFFNEQEFIKTLRIIRALVFRYIVISGLNPNNLENVYNNCAIKIFNKDITTAAGVMNELRSVYLSDEDFKNKFTTCVFETTNSKKRKLVRYILYSLENQKHSKNYPFDTTEGTIEHIIPENSNQEWQAIINPENHEMYVYRLGNLTLLEDSKNSKKAADKLFLEKKKYLPKKPIRNNKIVMQF